MSMTPVINLKYREEPFVVLVPISLALESCYRGKSLSSRDTNYSFRIKLLFRSTSSIKMKDFFKKFKKLFKGAKSGIDASSGTRAPEGASP